MLRASRRLLRPGGRTAFFTIGRATGLSAGQRRRASRDGPPAVTAQRPYRELLEAAGFTEMTEADCTAEFARITRAWIDQWEANRAEMVALWGEPALAERLADRTAQLRATEDGLLTRSLVTARRPGRRAGSGGQAFRARPSNV